jgi:hypothetical protein
MFTRTVVAALLVVASPALARAQLAAGSCEYTSDRPKAAGLSYCTQVQREEGCASEAATKASPGWLKAHPPRFEAGGDCTDGGKLLKKGKASAAKGQGKRPKTKQARKADAAS